MNLIDDDIFADDAEALVNPINCTGVMGAGLALQFKTRYPQYYQTYEQDCRNGKVRLGQVRPYWTDDGQPRCIISFPTKKKWRWPSDLDEISAGLRDMRIFLFEDRIQSVAVPALGCGHGRLAWPDVLSRIEAILWRWPVCDVRVYQPHKR